MSAAVEPRGGTPPAAWERLERATENAVVAVATWRARALRAEREAAALRAALEGSFGSGTEDGGDTDERLRAENLALRSRMDEARRRMQALHARLRLLEERR